MSKLNPLSRRNFVLGALSSLLAGNSIDGIFGYVSTISAAMKSDSSDENQQLRYLTYAEYAPDL